MLASDVDNPEFANPRNPDDALFVQFYMHDPVEFLKSKRAGKRINTGKKIPFVRIARPGDQTTVIEMAVRDDHKIRFPKQWMSFQIREGLLQAPPSLGWKIEEWDEIKDQEQLLHQLRYNRFETVEQLAGAGDGAIQNLGIGGLGLREKARIAIRDRRRAEFKEEMDAKDKQINDLMSRLEKLESMVPGNQTQQPNVKHDSGKQEPLHLPKKDK